MGEVKIYTDESVDVAIAEGLQRRGIEAISARDRNNLGLTALTNTYHPDP